LGERHPYSARGAGMVRWANDAGVEESTSPLESCLRLPVVMMTDQALSTRISMMFPGPH